jgi:hypothetical protein
MSDQNLTVSESKPSKNSLAAGLILVTIGLGMLLFQLINLPLLFPLVLGTVFLASGIITRKAGLLIPGGIIGGVGLGVLVTQSAWAAPVGTLQSGGVFLLAFALGWFLIALLSKLFTDETQTWALIPGAIMAVIGGLTLAGEAGLRILEQAGRFWPAILVLIGLRILYRGWKERK